MDRTNLGTALTAGVRRLQGTVAHLSPWRPTERDLWRLTVENSPIGTCLVTTDGRLTVPNHAFAVATGYTRAQLRELTFAEITHEDDVDDDMDLFDQTLRGERSSYRLLKRFIRSNGEVMWGDLSVAIVRADDDTPLHFISQVLDVTRQREDQERLQKAMAVIDEERSQLQAILDTVDVGIVLVGRDGAHQRQNRRQQEILTMADPAGAPLGAGMVGHYYAEDGRTPLAAEQMPSARAAGGTDFKDERMWVGPDAASRRALSVSARTVRDAAGEPRGAALAYSDVTDLVHALKAREVFESSVSHELRTPLTAVLGHLEMVLDEKELPPGVAKQLQVAQRNADRLRYLVSDLLDPAARGQGALALVYAPADVTAIVREVLGEAARRARDTGINLVGHATEAAPAVVDAHRVRQVLDNVVSNAVKYTDPDGRIDVWVEKDGENVVVTVADTGIGIAPEALAQLWEPFFRADEARERVTPGVGLGLGIARSIVTAHSGRIEVSSQLGQGSTFRITLPSSETPALTTPDSTSATPT